MLKTFGWLFLFGLGAVACASGSVGEEKAQSGEADTGVRHGFRSVAQPAPTQDAGSAKDAGTVDAEVADGQAGAEVVQVDIVEEPEEVLSSDDSLGLDTSVDVDGPVDDAMLMAMSFPSTMECGEVASVSVTMQNTGTSNWIRTIHRLVPLEASSLFYEKSRVKLPDGVIVVPGATFEFTFEITAPEEEGDHVLSWRMRSEEGLFGTPAEALVGVTCPVVDPGPDPTTDPPPIADDFSNVIWIHEDISAWQKTVTLEAVKGPFDQIKIYNNGTTCGPADVCWPPFNPSYKYPGDNHYGEFVGGVWIFVYQDGTWVAGLFDSILVGQQNVWDHNLVPGSGWPGGLLDEFKPESGELYGFMISTAVPVLSTTYTINERSNVSQFVWP